jgi:hypothetical protein
MAHNLDANYSRFPRLTVLRADGTFYGHGEAELFTAGIPSEVEDSPAAITLLLTIEGTFR